MCTVSEEFILTNAVPSITELHNVLTMQPTLGAGAIM